MSSLCVQRDWRKTNEASAFFATLMKMRVWLLGYAHGPNEEIVHALPKGSEEAYTNLCAAAVIFDILRLLLTVFDGLGSQSFVLEYQEIGSVLQQLTGPIGIPMAPSRGKQLRTSPRANIH